MKKHGIYYGTRELSNGYGIYVSTWRNGHWIETDTNTKPWPTREIALKQAQGAAEARRDNGESDLPVMALS